MVTLLLYTTQMSIGFDQIGEKLDNLAAQLQIQNWNTKLESVGKVTSSISKDYVRFLQDVTSPEVSLRRT